MMEWRPIDRDSDQHIPKDRKLLLGWFGYGGKWETCTDFYHCAKGGWYHGSAEYWMPLPEPPKPFSEYGNYGENNPPVMSNPSDKDYSC